MNTPEAPSRLQLLEVLHSILNAWQALPEEDDAALWSDQDHAAAKQMAVVMNALAETLPTWPSISETATVWVMMDKQRDNMPAIASTRSMAQHYTRQRVAQRLAAALVTDHEVGAGCFEVKANGLVQFVVQPIQMVG